MIHVVSEIHVSSNGHRLMLRACISSSRLVVEMSSAGYGFPGRSPIAFSCLVLPQARSIRLRGATYASGLPLREGALADFEAHLLGVLKAFVERRPEVFLHQSFVVRQRLEGRNLEMVVVETSMGDVLISRCGDGAIAEMLILSGSRAALIRGRELLARISAAPSVEAIAWALDPHGPRQRVSCDEVEASILSAIAARLPPPGEPLSNMIDAEAVRGEIDYTGLASADLPADAARLHGVVDTAQLVDKVNVSRSRKGLPPLARGNYPSNMIRLRAFLRLAAKELRTT